MSCGCVCVCIISHLIFCHAHCLFPIVMTSPWVNKTSLKLYWINLIPHSHRGNLCERWNTFRVCVRVCVGGVFPLITSEDNRQTTLEWLQPALTYRQCEGVRQSDPSRGIQIDYDDNNDAFQGLVFSWEVYFHTFVLPKPATGESVARWTGNCDGRTVEYNSQVW